MNGRAGSVGVGGSVGEGGSVGADGGDRGLPAERTSLAWTRTSFAVLGNGVLMLLRQTERGPGSWRLALLGLAAVVAMLTYVAGRQRQRLLRPPLSPGLSPRPQVLTVGIGVLALVVATGVVLLR